MQLILRCVLLAVLSIGGCADGDSGAESPAEGSTGSKYFLSPADLEKLERMARKGDATAAMRVADHYSLGLDNPKASLEWRRMAARFGSISAMRDMASDLVLGEQVEASCAEAKMWIGKAEASASREEAVTLELSGVKSIVDQRCADEN